MTLSFQARTVNPYSLTIELDAFTLPIPSSATNLFPPLRQPPLMEDTKLFGKAWAQGWITPMTNRLVALGGNLQEQLVAFECPSLDTTDIAWGASGTIDGITDPVTVQATPFGTSVYGRQFAVGDYVIWNDPSIVNGKYAYEIDKIIALNQNTFTLQRSTPTSGAGFAQFGSIKTAHTNIQFLQMLDKTFFDYWDGSHQVYEFFWPNKIVSAVSISTVGAP